MSRVDLSSSLTLEARLIDGAASNHTHPQPFQPHGDSLRPSQDCYFISSHAELYFWTYPVTHLTGPVFTEGLESRWSTLTRHHRRHGNVPSGLSEHWGPREITIKTLITRPPAATATCPQQWGQSTGPLTHYTENQSPRPHRAKHRL